MVLHRNKYIQIERLRHVRSGRDINRL